MAEETKSILIEVDLKINDSIKKIGSLKKSIEEIGQEIDEQEKKKANKDPFFDPEKLELLNQTLKATKTELRSMENVTQKAIQANNINTNSIEKARLALSLVSKEWARVADLYGKNSIEAQKLARQKDELTEAIKREERATGDARRNVGNYPFESIRMGWLKIAGGVTAAIALVGRYTPGTR